MVGQKLRGADPQELGWLRRGRQSVGLARDERLCWAYANGLCAWMVVRAGADVNGGGGSETEEIQVFPGTGGWVAGSESNGGSAAKSPASGSDALVLMESLAERAQRTTNL